LKGAAQCCAFSFVTIHPMLFSVRVLKSPGFWLVLFVVGTILLAYLSLVKAPTVQIALDTRNRIVHFLAYLLYSAVLAMWRLTSRPGRNRRRLFIEASLPSAAYGILLEWAQAYLPHRDADPVDGLCNVLGAFAGALLLLLYFRKV
jgi:VanZ family protein